MNPTHVQVLFLLLFGLTSMTGLRGYGQIGNNVKHPCDVPSAIAVKGRTEWSNCNFKNSNFNEADFKRSATFDGSIFQEFADFYEIMPEPGNTLSFKNVGFKKGFSLYRMNLEAAYFDNSVFERNADFERIKFTNGVSFAYATFRRKVRFIDMNFGRADFSHLILTERTEFNIHNSLATVFDFSFNPKIPGEIRLVDALGPGVVERSDSMKRAKCLINLFHSDISKFYLNYVDFKLYFPRYRDPSGDADSVEITLSEKYVVYEALLNNFKAHGQTDDYQRLDIEYQSLRYENNEQHFYNWLNRLWWNYGYDKEYIFLWVIGLIVFFTMINFWFINYLRSNIYHIEGIEEPVEKIVSIRDWRSVGVNVQVVLLRLWYALVYTSAVFFLLNMKIENFNFKRWGGVIYVFVIYTSGLICLAYMANFILKK